MLPAKQQEDRPETVRKLRSKKHCAERGLGRNTLGGKSKALMSEKHVESLGVHCREFKRKELTTEDTEERRDFPYDRKDSLCVPLCPLW